MPGKTLFYSYSTKAEKPVPNLEELVKEFESEVIVEVRTGKVKPLYNLPVMSAIYKNPHKNPVKVTFLGLQGDEQAYEFHGGPDKAIHQYSSQHYSTWSKENPQSAHRFTIGGFGENLVSSAANERNLCIGDIIRIGDEVRVQVSLPRQPCYKLNHRFEVKDMSRQSQEKSRTGWYYRVLTEGYIQSGDIMVLESRRNPSWTIAAVQHYLYRDMTNTEAMQELVQLEDLGEESKGIFRNRLQKGLENQEGRLVGGDGMALQTWSDYRLISRISESPRISSFRFEAIKAPETIIPVLPGSHVRLKLGGNILRAYSVVSGTSASFVLGVALASDSRGGSSHLHHKAQVGDIFSCSPIVASFPLKEEADHHLLIAGGIGITAFLAAAKEMQNKGQSYSLHVAVRDAEDVPFQNILKELSPNVFIHDKAGGNGLNVKDVISKIAPNTYIYCCGPDRLMDAVTVHSKSLGVPENHVFFEAFAAATSGDPFSVELALSKKEIEVPANKSLLDVLREVGLDVSSSCEAGSCGTCKVPVKCGRVEHRGTGLFDDEKEGTMLSCVSRGVGKITLDL